MTRVPHIPQRDSASLGESRRRRVSARALPNLKYNCFDASAMSGASIAGAGVCDCPAPPRLHSFPSAPSPLSIICGLCSHCQELSNAAKMESSWPLCPLPKSVHRWPFLALHCRQCSAQLNSGLLVGVRQPLLPPTVGAPAWDEQTMSNWRTCSSWAPSFKRLSCVVWFKRGSPASPMQEAEGVLASMRACVQVAHGADHPHAE